MSDPKQSPLVGTHIEQFQVVPRVQSIIWTIAPKGRGRNGNLLLSLIVSPRLQVRPVQHLGAGAGEPSEVQLSYFPDFTDWPAWLEQTLFRNLSITFQSSPAGGNQTFTAVYQPLARDVRSGARKGYAQAKQIALVQALPIDPALWPKVFPPSTKVRSFTLALDQIKFDPTPMDNLELERHIEDIYARCGLEFPNLPPIDRMMDEHYFGPLMDEIQKAEGAPAVFEQTKADTSWMAASQGLFDSGTGPAQTMSYHFPAGSGSAPIMPSSYKIDVGSAYKPIIKRSQLHRKTVPSLKGAGPYDFHEIISILLNYPALLRKLGLVIDLEVRDTAEIMGAFHVGLNAQGLQGAPWKFHAAPLTHCVAAENAFSAVPRHNSGMTPGGMLAFEHKEKYRLMQTDVIGGGFRGVQYAMLLNVLKQSGAETAALPADRTVGLGMRMMDRITKQQDRFKAMMDLDRRYFEIDQSSGMISGIKSAPPLSGLFADDLMRGFRVDAAVYDEATQSWKWHSLCRREVQYVVGNEVIDCKPATGDSPDAEGVVTTGLAKQPAGDDGHAEEKYHLLESLFRWNGWSLCVPPPSEEDWPGDACEPNSGAPASAGSRYGLNVTTRITVACGSLPLLRFGKKYKFRARVADLAGNSPPWDSTQEKHASDEIEFRRFEPVPTPIVRPAVELGSDSPGESLETLVIRSNYNTQQEERPAKRFFYPPQTSLALAEYHGMFDVNGRFDPDTAKTIVKEYVEPLRDQENFTTNYITDPLARGVVFYGLPGSNAPVDQWPFPTSVEKWPENKKNISIRIKEGSKPPKKTGDTITVYLPKAEVVRVFYSSQMVDTGLDCMAQWERVRTYPQAESNSAQAHNLMLTAESAARQGLHAMITPQRELVLVHAVQQPLEAPVLVPVFDPDNRKRNTMRRELNATWSYLDSVVQIHGKSTGSVDVYAYWTEFIDDPETDEEVQTSAMKQHVLRADVHLNGAPAVASSGGFVHYMEKSGTGGLFLGTHINDVVVQSMKKQTNKVKKHNDAAYELAKKYNLSKQWGNDRVNQIAEDNNIDAAEIAGILQGMPPKHEFTDTKHRAIVYEVEGTTRFREYFGPMRRGATAKKIIASGMLPPTPAASEAQPMQPAAQTPGAQAMHPAAPTSVMPEADPAEAAFRRTGPKTMTIHIPSSARPAPVRISYAIPTFGWEPLRQEGHKLIRTRRGNGIRVFVERPWFSSGEDELLGVVVFGPTAALTGKRLEAWRPYISQWGRDPIWKTADLPADVPRTMHFIGGRETAHNLSLAEKESETQGHEGFSVIGYATTYDKDRGLWYADIEMRPGNVYFPFVRLALVRYQPYSVKNAHLSATKLTDFIQLLPDRTATVTLVHPNILKINVTGVFCDECYSKVTTTLEMARENISDAALQWEPVKDPELSNGFVGKHHTGNHVYSCSGVVSLPAKKANERYRIVVKETEQFIAYDKKSTFNRLVYADAFELDY